MRKIRRALIVSAFILTAFLLTPPRVKAQDVPNYVFLEIVDSNEKPVGDALVQIAKMNWETRRMTGEYGDVGRKTSAYGTVNLELPHIDSDFTQSVFKISKPGYFDFFDFGVPIKSRDHTRVAIELLKIPETPAEKNALGDEQQKREFLWAAKNGQAEIVRRFLKKGFSPNLSTDALRGVSAPQGIAAVLFAAGSGDARTVKTLLDAGASVRSQSEPLHSILAYYILANPLFRQQPPNESERKKIW